MGGDLRFGTWNVLADGGAASLAVGSGGITSLSYTNVNLSGVGAQFAQLDALTSITAYAHLSVGGRNLTLNTPVSHSGTLDVNEGGSVAFNNSTNLSAGTLSGGTWNVIAGAGTASLSVGSGNITMLAANTSHPERGGRAVRAARCPGQQRGQPDQYRRAHHDYQYCPHQFRTAVQQRPA